MLSEPARLVELRTSIAQRLRTVCGSMPQDEFDRLVQRIAQIEYKYEQIELGSARADEVSPRIQ
jgi:hypothetical protein